MGPGNRTSRHSIAGAIIPAAIREALTPPASITVTG
jgi:hypothetical protein